MQNRCVTVMAIGDTGNGKSTFGNLYLQRGAFKHSDSPDPVSKGTVAESSVIDGTERNFIDTEGLQDGNNNTSDQIRKNASFLCSYPKGVNVVAIIINGQADRFSQSAKDNLKFVYDSFGTNEIKSHICVVFTKCYVNQPNSPNRQTKRGEYAERVRNYLSVISGEQNVPIIPVFFVDCLDDNSIETRENMVHFHDFVTSRSPLNTSNFIEANYHEAIEEEIRERYFDGFVVEGNITYEKLLDQKRKVIIPNNGNPKRYGEWETINSYNEAIKIREEEIKDMVNRGYTFEGNTRFENYAEQRRDKITNLRTNEVIYGPWYDIREWKIEKGEKIVRKKYRTALLTKKTVEHHNPHAVAGLSSHNHTHYKILKETWKEVRDEITDPDGNVTYSEYTIVPGTKESKPEEKGRERGHTDPSESIKYN